MTFIPHSYPDLDPQDITALKECFDRGFVGWDKDIEEVLKKDIQKFVGKSQVVFTPSGSMALLIALRALGIKAGDPVLMPAIDCWSVYNAILFLGGRPVIYDLRGPKDFRPCFDTIAQQVKEDIKIVIVTHMFGVLIEQEEIRRLKEDLKLHVIEDYASSFGALYSNVSTIGKFSDFVIGSFASTKAITSGTGGFIASNKVFMSGAHCFPLPDLLALNCQVSCLNQQLLRQQFLRFDKIQQKKNKLKQLLSRFVNIWGTESSGLYRAITFDNTEKLKIFFNEKGFQLDIRTSVQPNLAQELSLDLVNAKHFQPYSSIPFHTKFAASLEREGLI